METMMKKTLATLAFALFAFASPSFAADVTVQGLTAASGSTLTATDVFWCGIGPTSTRKCSVQQVVNSLSTVPGSVATSPNRVYAGPTSNPAGAATFRALVGADLPAPTSTTFGGVVTTAVATSNWVNGLGTDGRLTASQPRCSDLSDAGSGCSAASTGGTVTSLTAGSAGIVLTPSTITSTGTIALGTPSPGTLGGAFSIVASSNNFLTGLGVDGTFTRAQPSAANLSNGTTGSGLVVLQTSPTLITPVLGVASGTSLSLSSPLTVPNGGTGLGSGTSGGVPYYSGSTTIASSAALTAHGVVIGGGAGAAPTSTSAGTSGQALVSNGASADPTFQTLPTSGGGTGAATFTNHGVLLGQASGTIVATAAGTNGQVLVGVTSADPTFATVSGDGTITNAGVITVTKTSGVSFAASATTDTTNAGNISTGTLGVARGGTGASLAATGGASQVLKQVTVGASVTVARLACADLSDSGTGCTGSGGGGSALDLQAFAASGTWTKPGGSPQWVTGYCVGGGGAGGSGYVYASVAGSGGQGGAGGGFISFEGPASSFGATETVTIGAGGTGGAIKSGTGDAVGNDGTAGGTTSFGTKIFAYGGGAGKGGSTTSYYAPTGGDHVQAGNIGSATLGSSLGNGQWPNKGGGGAGTVGAVFGSANGGNTNDQGAPPWSPTGGAGGASGNNNGTTTGGTGGNNGGWGLYGGAGGAAGGGGANKAGGTGGASSVASGGTAGATTGGDGGAGGSGGTAAKYGGGGGGGGASGATGATYNGGAGGVGGAYGGGGGGGGIGVYNGGGAVNSGAGGNGGAGYCVAATLF